MKKILFIICAVVCFGFASCTSCKGGHQQCNNQDTIVVNDTAVIETFDTLFVD